MTRGKVFLRTLLGTNLRSVLQLSGGLRSFVAAAQQAFSAAHRPESAELSRIPIIHLDEILRNRRAEVTLSVMRYEDGMLPSHQAFALLSILGAEAPATVLEIGTFMGHTTKLMAQNSLNSFIHTVDLPEDYESENAPQTGIPKDDFHLIRRRVVGREFRDHASKIRIKQHFRDTAEWDFCDVGNPDFFFIDGSHTYEYCKNDSEKCLAVAANSAVFLWHDCDDTHPGVIRFILEWRALGKDVRRIAGTPLAYWKKC